MRTVILLFSVLASMTASTAATLQQCMNAAVNNYPAIKQYDLISRTTELTVANINKGWLPQVSISAQATFQSDVTSWPSQFKTTFRNMGIEMEGLKKDQYRVGLDVNQTLYDGGAMSTERGVAVARGKLEATALDVTLHAVKSRVSEMYFAALLVDDRIKLSRDLATVLRSNEEKLKSMYTRGAAAQSDYLSVKAERLRAEQQVEMLTSQRATLYRSLEMFCGIDIDTVTVPEATLPATLENKRPELEYYDATIRLADAREKQLKSSVMPHINLFAQGFYGYPGYNMFEDMMRRRFSLNGMVGVKVTWNIGAFYTRGNDKARLALQRSTAESDRATFLLNNELDRRRQNDEYQLYSRLLASDKEIADLRTSVRKSAESRLDHGIIDVHDLIKETTAEHEALVQLSMHRIEMLKRISDLRLTTNN